MKRRRRNHSIQLNHLYHSSRQNFRLHSAEWSPFYCLLYFSRIISRQPCLEDHL